MSLVLAIQPDADQAARLAAICRRIGTDLVLASTAHQALASLGNRVPDVVLCPPLLPAHEEEAVAGRLRELGPAALHVQSLTAPLLGDTPPEPTRPRGLFSALRSRRNGDARPAACDATTFAQQMSAYLLRAVAERTALDVDALEGISIDEPWYQVEARIAAQIDGLINAGAASSLDSRSEDSEHRRTAQNAVAGGVQSSGPADLTMDDGPFVVAATEADLTDLLDSMSRDSGLGIRDPGVGVRDPGSGKMRSHGNRQPQRPRRKRALVSPDDAAYFDPARVNFAALVAAFDAVILGGRQ